VLLGEDTSWEWEIRIIRYDRPSGNYTYKLLQVLAHDGLLLSFKREREREIIGGPEVSLDTVTAECENTYSIVGPLKYFRTKISQN